MIRGAIDNMDRPKCLLTLIRCKTQTIIAILVMQLWDRAILLNSMLQSQEISNQMSLDKERLMDFLIIIQLILNSMIVMPMMQISNMNYK